MLNSNWLSCYLIISLLFSSISVKAQDEKLARLELEFKSYDSGDRSFRDSLSILISDHLCNEGNADRAITLLERVPDSVSRDFQLLVKAKAEYISDNYSQSLVSLQQCQENKLGGLRQKEYHLLKLLNFNHLLQIDSTATLLRQIYLDEKRDTSGLLAGLYAIPRPAFYNLRKARRSSLLPGAGLFYVNEKKHAAGSALMNLAFLGYTAYSIYTGYYITAALAGLPQFMRFYQGGKRASVKKASEKNQKAYLNYILQVNQYASEKIFANH